MATMKAIGLNKINSQYSDFVFRYWTSEMLYFLVPNMVTVKMDTDTPKLVLRGVFDSEYMGSSSSMPSYINFYRQITASSGNAL